jgi:predicted alpha/beta hydrolase
MNTTSPKSIQIKCADGYLLSAKLYHAQNSSNQAFPVLICPATGIVKEFYHAYAEWLSSMGYTVMSFDFRGIGASLHGPLKQSNASIVDWGQLDITAAIDCLLVHTAKEKVILLGHSAGGQLLGISPNHAKVAKVIAVAGSTGHVHNLKGKTKFLAPVMFHIVFPISNKLKGYGATKMIGMGENLPKKVAKQWAQFCGTQGYVMHAVKKEKLPDFHAEITCPITAIWASDDEIATPANVNAFLQLYPNATTSMIELKPQQYQHKSIGHMHMFRKSHRNLWQVIEQQFRI